MPVFKNAQKIMIYGLLTAIAVAALMQGAVESWSLAILQGWLLALLGLWFVKAVWEQRFTVKFPATFYPLLGLLLFASIQSFTFTNQVGMSEGLSLDTEATFQTVRILTFLIIGLLIAANFITETEHYSRTANFMIFFGFALAVFAILQYFTWNGHFFWVIPAGPSVSSGMIGSFVNRNHFAGFMELLIPLPIALLLTGAGRDKKLLYGFAACVMMLALLFSLSRGGIISIFIGLVITTIAGLFYNRRKNSKEQISNETADILRRQTFKRTVTVFTISLGLIAAVTIGTVWLGIDPVIDRISNNDLLSDSELAPTFHNSRGWIWENTLNIFWANPLTGTGLGSFETVYPNYSTTDETLSINRAHNDYLQLLAEGGIIGAVLCLWFFAAVIYQMITAFRETDPLRAGFAIGCIGALAAMAVHSIFDFNLQLPSNALLILVLTGALSGISAKANVTRKTSEIGEEESCSEKDIYALGVSS